MSRGEVLVPSHYQKASGGTELAHRRLMELLPDWAVKKVQVISRPEDVDASRLQVFWTQDLPNSPVFLSDAKARSCFDGIVFVSYWQQTIFAVSAGVPFSEGTVIKNAIDPITGIDKDDTTIRLIYQSAPDRGLDILVESFIALSERYKTIELDVFSNFDLYDQPERNAPFLDTFQACRDHPRIHYHGARPNSEVRDAVAKAHIFAYPSIWLETSCMSAMEAMSAKCLMVAPLHGALPETMANYQMSYSWSENRDVHLERFTKKLEESIISVKSEEVQRTLDEQKRYADRFYSWDTRIHEWVDFLAGLKKTRTMDFPGFNL